MVLVQQFFESIRRKYEICYRIDIYEVSPSEEREGYNIASVKLFYKNDFYVFHFFNVEDRDHLTIWYFQDSDLKKFNDCLEFSSISAYVNLIKAETYFSKKTYSELYKDICEKFKYNKVYKFIKDYPNLNFETLIENKDLILAPIQYVNLNIDYYETKPPLIPNNNKHYPI